MTQRIAVLGAGANGSSIGADLAMAGLDVVLIDQWPENVEAMRRRGLCIKMPTGVLQTPVRAFNLCDICTFTERFDIVLLLVKAYDTAWATRLIEPYLDDRGIVVGVQNGMTVDHIAAVVGPARTMGCVIEISSNMFDPGLVNRDSDHDHSWFAVGAIDESAKDREEEVAALLRHSGAVERFPDIRAAKWMKLVSNATTLGATALLGLPVHDAMQLPGVRELMLRAGQEALDVGAALGHPALPIFGLKPEELRQSNRLVETMLDTLLAGFTLPTTKTTVLQDWMKGRRSEVGDINDLVVHEADAVELSAPVNAAIGQMAREVEAGRLVPGPGNLNRLLHLAGITS